jgi:DNA-directed RNA polymerase specialized sigma24 family protein
MWMIVLLNQALEMLAGFDQRKARVVEMRFFGGLTAEEIAAVLEVAPQTVHRDWSLAKAWLLHRMQGAASSDEGNDGSSTLGQD